MQAFVLDTDVLVAAVRSEKGASRRFVDLARASRFQLLLSVPLMLEYEAVLTRPEHLAASGASEADIAVLLDDLAAVGKQVAITILVRPLLPDANDDMVFETAINGRADAVVTFNTRDFAPAASRFGISVMTPGRGASRIDRARVKGARHEAK
jgi:putative PIN family toxin of toxin-antitoxin system